MSGGGTRSEVLAFRGADKREGASRNEGEGRVRVLTDHSFPVCPRVRHWIGGGCRREFYL